MNATARSRETRTARRHLTIADVCRAIAEGELPARQQGQWYKVRRRDVVDYASRLWLGVKVPGSASSGAL